MSWLIAVVAPQRLHDLNNNGLLEMEAPGALDVEPGHVDA